MSKAGFIYILTNPSIEGLVKVGKTARTPVNRVAELSSATGVPTPFNLVYFAEFEDCDAAERLLHAQLTERQTRVSANREFFRVPTHEAVSAVVELQHRLRQELSQADRKSDVHSESDSNKTSIVETLLADADSYAYGTAGRFRDLPRAMSILKQAVDLQSGSACLRLGSIYRDEDDVFDLQKSKACLLRGVELGDVACYAELAETFLLLEEPFNSEMAWTHFFQSSRAGHVSELGYYVLKCVEQVAKRGLNRNLLQLAKRYEVEALRFAAEAQQRATNPVSLGRWKAVTGLARHMLQGMALEEVLDGHIKWFDVKKDYGFVTDLEGRDHFLQRSELLNSGPLPLPKAGDRVRFQTAAGPHGPIAVNVTVLGLPGG